MNVSTWYLIAPSIELTFWPGSIVMTIESWSNIENLYICSENEDYLPQQILTSSAWSLQQYTRNCLRYLDIFRKWMDILCMLVNMQIGCNDNCMNALCFGYLILKLGSNSLHFILLCTQQRCRRDDVWISDSQIAIFRWNVKIALNTWMTNDFPPTV